MNDPLEAISKDKAFRNALLNSRNPKADLNNPNNPIYKARLAGKDIESLIESTKNKIEKEKHAEKRIEKG